MVHATNSQDAEREWASHCDVPSEVVGASITHTMLLTRDPSNQLLQVSRTSLSVLVTSAAVRDVELP